MAVRRILVLWVALGLLASLLVVSLEPEEAQAAGGVAGGYTAVQPVRVQDSRRSDLGLAGAWGANQTRDLTVTGVGGVPAEATAVVLNVTVTGGSAGSNLRLWPSGQPQPGVSNLNWEAGQTIPNLVVVKVGAGGKVSIRNQAGSVHVLADVVGYFGPTGDGYSGVLPVRVQDSRRSDLGLAGAWGANQTRDLTVTGVGGVPAEATAVVLNVTVTGGSAGSNLRLWPSGQPQPGVSNLNWEAGQTIPNLVVVKVGAGGKVSIRNQAGSVHVLADVVGYFGPTGDGYSGVLPVRVQDSRRSDLGLAGAWGANQTRDLTVTGVGGVPAEATAVVLNVTVTGGSAGSNLRLWPSGQPQPGVSNLNWEAGQTIPNLVVVKVGAGGKVSIRNQAGSVHVLADVVGYFRPPPDVTPPPVPSGVTATAGNGQATVSWNAVSAPDLAGYNLYRSTSSGSLGSKVNTTLITGTSRVESGLTNGTAYFWRVKSVDTTGNESAQSAQVSAIPSAPDTTPPPVPSGVTATAGNGQATVSWNAVSAPDLAGYNLYRSTSSGSLGSKVNTTLITGTSRVESGLTNGTAYFWRVKSVDTTGNESAQSAQVSAIPSAPDTTPPPVPSGVAAVAGNGQATVSWNAVTAPDLAGYNLYRSTSAGSLGSKVNTTLITGTSRVESGLTNGTTYFWRVKSVDASGNESVQSPQATATPSAPDTTPPPVPTGVAAVAGNGQATVSWNAVTAPDLAGYNLYRSTSAGSLGSKVNTAPISGTSWVETGLTNGTTYFWRVKSVDTTGNESAQSSQASASPTAVITHCGALPANETWAEGVHLITCPVEIPGSITLAITAGAIVKFGPSIQNGILVGPGGVLNVAGSAASKVRFTSWRDDSVGGDSNGDGGGSSPTAGDYSTAIRTVGSSGVGPVVNVAHVDVRYAGAAVTNWPSQTSVDSGGSVTVVDSTIRDSQNGLLFGTYFGHTPVNTLTVERTTFTDLSGVGIHSAVSETVVRSSTFGNVGSHAIYRDGTVHGIHVTGPSRNVFTGTGAGRTIVVSALAPAVPAGQSWTVDSTGGAVILVSGAGLEVAGTMTVGAGTLVKFSDVGGSYDRRGILVGPGGVLNVAGSAASKVRFTSWRDDSVGGDSNGDGGGSSPTAGDYSTAIRTVGSSGVGPVVNVAHVDVRYAGAAVTNWPSQTSVDSGGSVTVVDSTIRDSQNGLLFGTYFGHTPVNTLTVERTTFTDLSGVGIHSAVSETVVRSSTFGNVGSHAIYRDGTVHGIHVTGPSRNVFTGTGAGRTIVVSALAPAVPAGQSWTVDSTGGAVILVSGAGLEVAGTMTVGAGTLVKFSDVGGSYDRRGILVGPGGVLNVAGSAASKVRFTSWRDDSVGGDSNGDGGGSSPTAGDYSTAIRTVGSSGVGPVVNVAHVDVRYAGAAVTNWPSQTSVDSGGSVTVVDSTIRDSQNGLLFGTYFGHTPVNTLTVERTTFTDLSGVGIHSAVSETVVRSSTFGNVGSHAIYRDGTVHGIHVTGPSRNVFTGTGAGRTIVVSALAPAVPAGQSWTVDSTGGAVILVSGAGLEVAGTMTVGAGTLVKFSDVGGSYDRRGILVGPGGVLNVAGSAASKVRFTSWRDDSVGGDSNGDGGGSSPTAGDYSTAIRTVGSSGVGPVVNVAHVDVRYAGAAVTNWPSQTSVDSGGSVTVVDSTIRDSQNGLLFGTYFGHTPVNTLTVERTTFTDLSGVGIHSAVSETVVRSSTFGNVGSHAIYRDGTVHGIHVTGPSRNVFTGTGAGRTIVVSALAPAVPAGQSWTVDSTGGAVILVSGAGLEVAGTMTVGAGTLVKFSDVGGSYDRRGILVGPGGVLNVAGSAASKVRFTSWRDDSVGGDSNGDGGGSSPTAGDYSTAIRTVGSSGVGPVVNVAHVDVRYAGAAVTNWPSQTSVDSGGSVTVVDSTIRDSQNGLLFGTYFGHTPVNTLTVERTTFTDLSGVGIHSAVSAASLSAVEVVRATHAVSIQGGSAQLRGALREVDAGVTACNWGTSDCHLDAAYVDWGQPTGPNSPGAASACGQVLLSPWVGASPTDSYGMFGSGNCDGSQTPSEQLAVAAAAASYRIAHACDGLGPDVCSILEIRRNCMSAAVEVAGTVYPNSEAETLEALGTSFVDGASLYLRNSASQTISTVGAAASRASAVLTIVNTTLALVSAYNSCP